MNPLPPGKDYHAFLSYKREPDEHIAAALQQGMQSLARPWTSWRAIRVFRDITSIPASSDLSRTIRDRLNRSEYFVLLASPEAFMRREPDRATWVEQELAHWLSECGGASKVLIGVTAGECDWDTTTALPPAMKERFPTQPALIDLQWARDPTIRDNLTLRNPRFADAVAAFSEPIRGIEREKLFSEDGRQHRRAAWFRRTAIIGLATLFVGAMILAVWAMYNAARAELNRRRAVIQTELEALAQKRAALAAWKAGINERIAEVNAKEATMQQAQAEQQSTYNYARRLAAQSEAYRAEFPERSALLAVAAFETLARSPVSDLQVEEAIRRAWTNLGGSVPMRHKGLDAFAVSRDGRLLATGSNDGSIRLWNLDEPLPSARSLNGHPEAIRQLVFSPDGKWLVSSGAEDRRSNLGRARVWRVEDGKNVKEVTGSGEADEIEFSPAGEVLVIRFRRGDVQAWPMTRDGLGAVHELVADGSADEIAFSPEGSWFAIVRFKRNVELWLASSMLTADSLPLSEKDHQAESLAFSPDGRWLVTTGVDPAHDNAVDPPVYNARLWKLPRQGLPLERFQIPKFDYPHQPLLFSRDSRTLLNATYTSIRIWNLPQDGAVPTEATLRSHELKSAQRIGAAFIDATLSESGRVVAAVTEEGSVFIGDVQQVSSPLVRLPSATNVLQIAIVPGDRYLLGACTDGKLRAWDLESRTAPPMVLRGHEGVVHDLAVTRGARWVVTASFVRRPTKDWKRGGTDLVGDATVRRFAFSATSGPLAPTTLMVLADADKGGLFGLSQRSRDGRWIAVETGADLALVDLTRPRLLSSIRRVPGVAYGSGFSPQSSWFVSLDLHALNRGVERALILTDLRTSAEPIRIPLPKATWPRNADFLEMMERELSDYPIHAAWDPTERWLVMLGADGSGWLFDAKAGATPTLKTRLTEPGPSGFVPTGLSLGSPDLRAGGLAFSDDGKWLLAIASSRKKNGPLLGSARLWDLRRPEAIHDYAIPMPVVHSGVFVGDCVVFTAPDGSARMWRIPFSEQQGVGMPAPDGEAYLLGEPNIHANDRRQVVTLARNRAYLWDLSFVPPRRLRIVAGKAEGEEPAWTQAVFSSRNRWLALASRGTAARAPRVTLVRLDGQASVSKTLTIPAEAATRKLAFSPDEGWLAVGGSGKGDRAEHAAISLWDLRGTTWPAKSIVLKVHEKAVCDFVFSHDSQYLVSSALDQGIIKWNLTAADPARAHTFAHPASEIEDLSIAIFMEREDVLALTTTEGAAMTTVDRIPLDANRIQKAIVHDVGRRLSDDEQRRFLASGIHDGDSFNPALASVARERSALAKILRDANIDVRRNTSNLQHQIGPPPTDQDLDGRREQLLRQLGEINSATADLTWWNLIAIIRHALMDAR